MIEIFIIIAVSRKIAAMMKEKGRSAAGYVVIFVFLWVFGELMGAAIGLIASASMNNNTGPMNDRFFHWLTLVGALFGAAIGGGIGFMIASAMPEVEDERQRYLSSLDNER
jgi:NhaP-type Na+/H+ or K+/H+ antiporter